MRPSPSPHSIGSWSERTASISSRLASPACHLVNDAQHQTIEVSRDRRSVERTNLSGDNLIKRVHRVAFGFKIGTLDRGG
jgi:hypothetical protein